MNHYYLGRMKRDMNWPKAAEQFERMTQLSDTSATAWISLSSAYRQMGDSVRAIEALRTGTERVRERNRHWTCALRAAYEQFGGVDSATAVFEELLKCAEFRTGTKLPRVYVYVAISGLTTLKN